MHIGIIGAGNIGATLATLFVKAGHQVSIANSRGPESLGAKVAALGATVVPIDSIGRDTDALVLSVPQRAVTSIPASIFADAPYVIDANNYYPWRDGRIEPLDDGVADSVWVARHVKRPVVKVFNSIQSNSLSKFGRPAGADDRIALPLSGDHAELLDATSRLVDEIGFDPVIAGNLASSWRQQPGSPVYCTDLSQDELRRMLPLAPGERLPELRDAAIRAFMATTPPPTPEQRREIFRRLYLPQQS